MRVVPMGSPVFLKGCGAGVIHGGSYEGVEQRRETNNRKGVSNDNVSGMSGSNQDGDGDVEDLRV